MKKITLLFAFAATTLGFSQATHTIDFETPGVGADWAWSAEEIAPSLSIVSNPDANVNTSATVVKFETYSTDNAWALTVSDDNGEFTFDSTNAIVKIMVHKPVASNVGIKFEGSSAAIQIVVANTVINGWEELTFDFSAQIGNTYNRIVLIPDFAARTETHVNYFDNLQLPQGVAPATFTAPTAAAPSPIARNAGDVISIYSDAYAPTAISNFDAGWCGEGSVAEVQIATNATQMYKGNTCQGIEFAAVDASSFTNMHFDLYIASEVDMIGKVFNVKFVETTTGIFKEVNFNSGSTPALVAGQWNEVDVVVDLSDYDALNQFAITSNLNNTAWYDNMYFYKAATAGVEDFSANAVKMYPNPAKGVVNFSSASNVALDVAVYDMLGKQVLRANAVQSQLNISSLNPGMYFVNMTQGSNVSTKKLLVN